MPSPKQFVEVIVGTSLGVRVNSGGFALQLQHCKPNQHLVVDDFKVPTCSLGLCYCDSWLGACHKFISLAPPLLGMRQVGFFGWSQIDGLGTPHSMARRARLKPSPEKQKGGDIEGRMQRKASCMGCLFLHFPARVGPPARCVFTVSSLGEGSPIKVDYRKKRVPFF